MATGSSQDPPIAAAAFLEGGGEMGAVMRANNWAASPLGLPESWPECIKTAVALCLNSQFATLLWLGPELRIVYNDAFSPFLANAKRPAALGAPGHEVWSEMWHVLAPLHDQVREGRSIHVKDLQFFLSRHRPREEVYITFDCTPIRQEVDGAVQGVFSTCVETTAEIIRARQLGTLRELGRPIAENPTVEAVCEAAALAMDGNPFDVPFAAIYLLDPDRQNARHVAGSRLPVSASGLPDILPMSGIHTDGGLAWPLAEAGRTQEPVEVDHLQSRIGRFHAPIWGDAIETGIVLPLIPKPQEPPAGFVIAGISPRRVFDADYRSFLKDAARRISAAIADTHALEAGRVQAHSQGRTPEPNLSEGSDAPEEFSAISLLTELSTRLRSTSDLPAVLQEILKTTMELQDADFGDVQLYHEPTQTLQIAAHAGLDEEFLTYFRKVDASDTSACGQALAARARVMIEDVNTDPAYAQHRQIAEKSGYRAVQSTPLYSRNGDQPIGMVSTLFRNPRRLSERELWLTDLYTRQAADVITFKMSEQRLRESEARLQAAAGLIGLCSYTWNPQTNELEWDLGLRAIWGLRDDTPLDYDVFINGVHPDDRPLVLNAIAAASDPAGGGLYYLEYRVIRARDRSERWVATRGQTKFENGIATAFFGVALDITDQKRSEQAREVLIAELQHRTRNLLAVVSSIAAETIASSRSIDEFGPAFNDRLAALSRVQGLLSRGDDNVVTINELVHLELGALGAKTDGERIIVKGPEVYLQSKSVQILALALHELATNARKYGALSVPRGELFVGWKVLAEGLNRMLELEWHETNFALGKRKITPSHVGFGRTLIEEALPFQLDAHTSLKIDQNEVVCMINLALADQTTPDHG
jgi:PAS domain S-box-containing protein